MLRTYKYEQKQLARPDHSGKHRCMLVSTAGALTTIHA